MDHGSGQANKDQSWQLCRHPPGAPLGTRKSWNTFQPCTAIQILARNFHAGEYLVHDTVGKAYVYLDRFQPGSNLLARLFTILRNTFYSGVRKLSREVAGPDGFLAATLVTHPEHDGRLAMSEVLSGFEQLSPEHRDMVTLVGVSGQSYNVASRMSGIPVGTAKSRLIPNLRGGLQSPAPLAA